jgi:hypothetical protein
MATCFLGRALGIIWIFRGAQKTNVKCAFIKIRFGELG